MLLAMVTLADVTHDCSPARTT